MSEFIKRNIWKIIIIFCFFTSVYLLNRKELNKIQEDYSSITFNARIIKITKQYRGRYNLELMSTDKNKILISDYNFGNYVSKINIGDSIIKSVSTNCFSYKKDSIIIFESCNKYNYIEIIKLLP